MSTRYPGGFIYRSTPVVVGPIAGEGGSAPGIWTLEQAGYYKSLGTWPVSPFAKSLWSTGANNVGQLGTNNTIYRSSPVQISAAVEWYTGAAATTSAAAIRNGTIWSWGNNSYGQLGQNNTVTQSSPVQVGNLSNWRSVTAGDFQFIATKTDGTLWSFGRNNTGQLAQGNTTNRSSPVQVGLLTTWASCAANKDAFSAIRTDGTIWTWGRNFYGQLGTNTNYTVSQVSPVQVGTSQWSYSNCGESAVYAIDVNSKLWAWGYGIYGGLGDGTQNSRSSPVQIGNDKWQLVSGGHYHAGGIKSDGSLWMWGYGNNGQLGNGSSGSYASRSSPVQIGALTTWQSVSAGNACTFAVKNNGTLWSWGQNYSGQLGQNIADSTIVVSPVQIGTQSSWARTFSSSGYFSIMFNTN
jgi:alpha-tubulin suppressor-like RCC1 family protein